MDRTKTDFVKTWGDLDLKKTPLSDLFQSINQKLENGVDINAVGLRSHRQKDGFVEQEEFTLTDWVISQKLLSKDSAEYERWNQVMSFLRQKGAKPACALKTKFSPAQKILNELSDLKKREKFLVQSLKQYRSR